METKLLEKDIELKTFADFSRAVPTSFRQAPVYICDNLGRYHRAMRMLLVRHEDGRKIVVIDHEISDLRK